MGLKEVVDSVADHIFDLLLLADHCRGIEERPIVHLAHLLLQPLGIIGFGAGGEGIEGRIQEEIIVEVIIFCVLEGLGEVIKAAKVLIPHFFLEREVCALRGLILEVNIGEIRVVDIHFADSSQQFSTIERSLRLSWGKVTFIACSF